MAHKYVCRQAGFQCDFELVDEDETSLKEAADEHVRQHHAEEVSQQGRNADYLLHGVRIIQ